MASTSPFSAALAAAILFTSSACLASGTSLPSTQSDSGDFFIVSSTSGEASNLTANSVIKIAAIDVGQQGSIYIAALVDGMLVFESPDGSWSTWRGSAPPAWFQGMLPSSLSVPIISGMNVGELKDLELFVGYGADVSDMTTAKRHMRFSPFDTSTTIEGYVTAVDQQCSTQTTTSPSLSNPAPLSGAVISSSLGTQTATTDAGGHVLLSLPGPASSQTQFTISLSMNGLTKTLTGIQGQHIFGHALVPRQPTSGGSTTTGCTTKPPGPVYCTTNAAGAPMLDNPPGCQPMGGTVCAPGVAPGTNGCVEKPPLCAVDASGVAQIGNPVGCVVASLKPLTI
ncbi:MAG: hypothetical protein KGZ83_02780 [Sulfuricella sp.]|nr:hypothetical protein [Sulfuricella sp.]